MINSQLVTAGACILAGAAAWAQPTSLNASVSLSTDDADGNFLDFLATHGGTTVDAGTTGILNAFDPSFGPSISVSFDVTTVGVQRTVLLTYTSLGDTFVTQQAVDLLVTDPSGFYVITFGVFFQDDQWDGGVVERTPALFGDGIAIVDPGSFNFGSQLAFGSHGFVGIVSPAGPGFFDADVVADTFTFEYVYTIVPAPSVAAVIAIGGVMSGRRRR